MKGLSFADFVEIAATKLGWTKKDVKNIYPALFEVLFESAQDHGAVNIPGFGKFSVISKEARTARNPKTGGTVDVPPRKVFRFTPSKSIKDFLKK